MNFIWFCEFSLAKDVKTSVLPNFSSFFLWKSRGIIISLDFCKIFLYIWDHATSLRQFFDYLANSMRFCEFSLAKDMKIPILLNFSLFLLWKLRGIIINLDFCQIIFHTFEIIFRLSREFYAILWVFLGERCEDPGSTKFFFLSFLKITKFRFL